MFEGMTCLYKSNVDLFFYIIGSGIKPPPPYPIFYVLKLNFCLFVLVLVLKSQDRVSINTHVLYLRVKKYRFFHIFCTVSSYCTLFYHQLCLVHENELVLMSVLDCIYNSVSQILRKNVDRRSLLDNLEVGSYLFFPCRQ